MYYHVILKRKGKEEGGIEEFDLISKDEILYDYILPYVNKDEFFIGGSNLSSNDILSLNVYESELTISQIHSKRMQNMSKNVIIFLSYTDVVSDKAYSKDITKALIKEAQEMSISTNKVKSSEYKTADNQEVFIVHGHGEALKEKTARFIEKLKLIPIILGEQANQGRTIIEKLEEHTDVSYGIVLYTACDVGAPKDNQENMQKRARQNVVMEHGYLMGKLGRDKVCALVEKDVETPSDMQGIVYIPIDEESWKFKVAKELRSAGFEIDTELIL